METKNVLIVCSEQTNATACSIAHLAACATLNVSLKCDDEASCAKAIDEINRIMKASVEAGDLKTEELDLAMGRIQTTIDIGDAKNADVIIECLFENEDLKRRTINELDNICSPSVIIATNTSTITVTSLARATKHPERVIGMHFIHFSPIMKVVELARGAKTSDEAFATAEALAKRLGQEIAISEDAPGLLFTRSWLLHINQAANYVYKRMGDAASLATLNRTLAPSALSPLESADFVGLDRCIALLQNLYQAYGDSKYYPSILLRQKVDAGELGCKTGKGFLEYA